jgi:hypothetical protein
VDEVLGVLLLVTGVVTVAYWVDFFVRGSVQVVEADWYLRFERAFPVADGFMAAASLVAGVGLLRGEDYGVAFGLVAGGALVFLGLMDVTFNVQNGLFRLLPGSTPMWAELVINVWSLALGAVLVGYLTGRVA